MYLCTKYSVAYPNCTPSSTSHGVSRWWLSLHTFKHTPFFPWHTSYARVICFLLVFEPRQPDTTSCMYLGPCFRVEETVRRKKTLTGEFYVGVCVNNHKQTNGLSICFCVCIRPFFAVRFKVIRRRERKEKNALKRKRQKERVSKSYPCTSRA